VGEDTSAGESSAELKEARQMVAEKHAKEMSGLLRLQGSRDTEAWEPLDLNNPRQVRLAVLKKASQSGFAVCFFNSRSRRANRKVGGMSSLNGQTGELRAVLTDNFFETSKRLCFFSKGASLRGNFKNWTSNA
jgi:hypothetical protein